MKQNYWQAELKEITKSWLILKYFISERFFAITTTLIQRIKQKKSLCSLCFRRLLTFSLECEVNKI